VVEMDRVAIYELKARRPRAVALFLATDPLIDTGITLYYNDKNLYAHVYYIGDGLLVIEEHHYYHKREEKIFIVRNGDRHFLMESINNPIIIPEGDAFVQYLRNSDVKKLCVCVSSGWRFSIEYLINPSERKELEKLMSEKFPKLYWYGGEISKQALLKLIDTVKQNKQEVSA
jgi:hypothetical protein